MGQEEEKTWREAVTVPNRELTGFIKREKRRFQEGELRLKLLPDRITFAIETPELKRNPWE